MTNSRSSHSVSSLYPDGSVMVRSPRLPRKRTTSRVTELSRPPQSEYNAKRAGKVLRAVPRDTEGEDNMAHLLLIDDEPALIPKLVRQVFPGPAHGVEVAGT